MPDLSHPVIACKDLTLSFGDGDQTRCVLDQVSLRIQAAESLAITGPSGSGKSSFMHCLAGLESADSGEVFWGGQALEDLTQDQIAQLRQQHIGMVYQFHHLLPDLNVLENVALPLLVAGCAPREGRSSALNILERLSLEDLAHQSSTSLSGGQRQRVAIARACVHKPKIIMADEPTGNLDQASAEKVIQLLLNLQSTFGCALVIVTHEESIAKQLNRQVVLMGGQISR